MANKASFDQRKPVDFAIIGSGAAGGIIAKELATAGFDVVVFEQGPYRRARDFTHDEYSVLVNGELMGGGPEVSGQVPALAGPRPDQLAHRGAEGLLHRPDLGRRRHWPGPGLAGASQPLALPTPQRQ